MGSGSGAGATQRHGSGTWGSGASSAGVKEEASVDGASKAQPATPQPPDVVCRTWLEEVNLQARRVKARRDHPARRHRPRKEREACTWGRLKLSNLATELSPENLPALTRKGLLTAVQGLESVPCLVFPVGIQLRLWDVAVQDLTSHAISCMEAQIFVKLWARMSPVSWQESLTLNLYDLRLCVLDLCLADKCQRFLEALVTNAASPLRRTQACQSAVCGQLLTKIEDVLLETGPDELVAILFDLQLCMKAVQAMQVWMRMLACSTLQTP